MNKIESFEPEPEPESRDETWVKRREGRGLVAPSRKFSCKCGRCQLYRWYPPLLVVSTVMTAVFCFLYLTKPVFLEAPAMKVYKGGNKVPPGYMIARAETGNSSSAPAPAPASAPDAGMRRELDPGLLSFPVESQEVDPVLAALSQPEPLDLLDVPPVVTPVEEAPVVEEPVIEPFVVERAEPMPVRVNVSRPSQPSGPALPGGFQPLRIEQPDMPLFQSLTKEDLARLDARRKAREAPAAAEVTLSSPVDSPEPEMAEHEPDAALVIDGIGDEPETVEVEAVVSEESEEGRGAEPGEEPVMRASLIGEFYLDEEKETAEQEVLLKTAMHM